MKNISVFDLPTRIFHWFFAFLFLTAYIIAETAGEESSLFAYHMMAGLTIGFIVVLRIIWGFTGTAYARFSSFKWHPKDLFLYFKDMVSAKNKKFTGHNPASGYAAIIMFLSALGLAATGIVMTSNDNLDLYEEMHEIFATILLITAIAHIAGIIIHQLLYRDSLWSSMLTGKKNTIPGEHGIADVKRNTGILFIILTFLWIGYVYSGYDSNSQSLDVFGTELVLGEEEHH